MIDTGAGVVDADYRGVLFVLLFNLSDKDFEGYSSYMTVLIGTYISQLKRVIVLLNSFLKKSTHQKFKRLK